MTRIAAAGQALDQTPVHRPSGKPSHKPSDKPSHKPGQKPGAQVRQWDLNGEPDLTDLHQFGTMWATTKNNAHRTRHYAWRRP